MSAVVFTLIFGVLAGIAGFGGAGAFETVLMLGMLGLTHMTVVAGRNASEGALISSSAGPRD